MRRAALAAVLAACTVKTAAGPGFRCEDGVTCPAGQRCLGGLCVEEGDSAAPPPDGAAPLPWWDDAWATRRRFTITNLAEVALPAGYELRWHVDLAAFGTDPWDDLRIVRWDGAAWLEQPRFIDDFGAGDRAQTWFALDAELAPGATTDAYWLYSDNPDAAAAGFEGPQVFLLFYDGFSGTALDTALWARQMASEAPASSELVLDPQESVRSVTTFGPGYAIDMRNRRSAAASDSWLGLQRSGDFTDDQPWALWIDWSGTGEVTPDTHVAAVGDTTNLTGPAVMPGTSEHLYTIERHPSRISFVYDGELHYERAFPQPYEEPLQIRLRNGSASSILYFENVRVRRVVDPAPTIEPGEPEARP